MFYSDNSETIVGCLVKEANKYNIEILMNRTVEEIVKGRGQWLQRSFCKCTAVSRGLYLCSLWRFSRLHNLIGWLRPGTR